MAIRVHYQKIKFKLSGSTEIKKWLTSAAGREGYDAVDLDYFFIDDNSQKKINSEFLEHHYNTDVITFDYTLEDIVTGEIYIAIETVKRNSEIYKTGFKQEYMRVMLHGMLHLLGYNDKSKEEQQLMREKEEFYLKMMKDGTY